MRYVYNDGGRAAAGFKGTCGDCATRAIAIATEKDYKTVYSELQRMQKEYLDKIRGKLERTKSSKSVEYYQSILKGRQSVRDGVRMDVAHAYFKSIGWEWVPTMKIGSGCQVHLNEGELPMGRLVCRLSRHLTAVIDGVVNDTYDPISRGSFAGVEDGEYVSGKVPDRCVYGYWRKA